MKKIISVLLILCMLFSCTACGGSENSGNVNNTESEQTQTEAQGKVDQQEQEKGDDKTPVIEYENYDVIPAKFFSYEFDHEDDKYEYYKIKVKEDFNAQDDIIYITIIGDIGNCLNGKRFSVSDLKKGIITSFKSEAIHSHNIPENIWIPTEEIWNKIINKEISHKNAIKIYGIHGISLVMNYNDFVANGYVIAKKNNDSSTSSQQTFVAPEDNGIDYSGLIKVYGLEKVKWTPNPKSNLDYEYNFLYSYMRGAWEYDVSPEGSFAHGCIWSEKLSRLANLGLNSYIGEWLNSMTCYAYLGSDGCFYIHTSGAEPPFTKEEMVQHVFDTYIEAVKLHDKFREKNKEISFKKQIDLAQAYWEFLIQYFYDEKKYIPDSWPGKETYMNGNTPETNIISVRGNGAYNLLVNNYGDCAPRAAVFDLMMRLEGIKCQSVGGEDIGGGHEESLFVADGIQYLCDWGNQRPIVELNSPEARLTFTPAKDKLQKGEQLLYNTSSSQLTPILGVVSSQYFNAILDKNSSESFEKYNLVFTSKYPDYSNPYIPWITDGLNSYKGSEIKFNHISEKNEPIVFYTSDTVNLQSKKIYLLTKDQSDRVVNGEISFSEAVEPYEKAQIEYFKTHKN